MHTLRIEEINMTTRRHHPPFLPPVAARAYAPTPPTGAIAILAFLALALYLILN